VDGVIPPLLLVGCGQMGGAMLAGWREQEMAPSVVVDPAAVAMPDHGGHRSVATLDDVPEGFRPELVVLAVKPQRASAVVPALSRFGAATVLSVMAGWTVAGLEGLLGRAGVVRAMPNTPAAIRQGMSVAFAGGGVGAEARALCDRLLRAVGAVAWVDEERMLDAVTAISGGGPAYVFLLAELLEREGVAQGLPPALARELARRTVSGSGALLGARTEDAAVLRQAVTSPRGTTERALAVLMADAAWPALLREAVAAAAARARELAAG
jgi:pyrroline-5-carboxylate reductase